LQVVIAGYHFKYFNFSIIQFQLVPSGCRLIGALYPFSAVFQIKYAPCAPYALRDSFVCQFAHKLFSTRI